MKQDSNNSNANTQYQDMSSWSSYEMTTKMYFIHRSKRHDPFIWSVLDWML